MKVEYSSNNSGGSFWLSDQNWKDLEAAGWDVEWVANNDRSLVRADEDGRWLGTLATNASKEFDSLGAGIDEWERVTGQYSNDLGCNCCGPPHSFMAYDDDDNYVASYSPDYPTYGDRY